MNVILCMFAVAPVWERGLKYKEVQDFAETMGRSRLGAWIEIFSLTAEQDEEYSSLPFGSVD